AENGNRGLLSACGGAIRPYTASRTFGRAGLSSPAMAGWPEWCGRATLVTGGASFIGSALVTALVARGANVRVVDDLSSGKLENIQLYVERGAVEFIEDDLRRPGAGERAVVGKSDV